MTKIALLIRILSSTIFQKQEKWAVLFEFCFKKGKFGPRVQDSIDEYVEIFKHVKIECSSSGKMGKVNVQKWFQDVFEPDVREGEGNILLLDSFGGPGENAKCLL